MRILLISSSYNGLCQRAHVELDNLGYDISITLALSAEDVRKAVALFQPDLIISPFLKERIPADVYHNHRCIILHPGIKGDRGPSSLDWAIVNEETEWGATALQAVEEMDAGDIWATCNFPMRQASKASLYRREVTQAAIKAMLETVRQIESGDFTPEPLDYSKSDVKGQLRPLMKQKDRPSIGRPIRSRPSFARSMPEIARRGFSIPSMARNFISTVSTEKATYAVGSQAQSLPNGTARSAGRRSMARCGFRTCAAKKSTSCRSIKVSFRVRVTRLISNCPRPWRLAML
jgi:hypothetical protein